MALPTPEAKGLNQLLHRYAREGILYEKLDGSGVRCFSCGHRCVIKDGRAGICLVRYNEGGKLFVPHGYVVSLQLDPVEKKPFFHAYPGSLAMSFGMLGCDYHCGYCVRGSTLISTSLGPKPIEDLFSRASLVSTSETASIASPGDLRVYSHAGRLRKVRQIFKHRYQGDLIRLKPRYLPAVEITPDHELLVGRDGPGNRGSFSREFIPAAKAVVGDFLVIPKRFNFSETTTYESSEILSPFLKPIRHKRTIPAELIGAVLDLTAEGYSSKEIGFLTNKGPSHVRHLRSKIRRGIWKLSDLHQRPGRIVAEEDMVRYVKEHGPGIPAAIPLDQNLARLIGYYLAEGSVVADKKRVLAATLVFSFGRHEGRLAAAAQDLLRSVFHIDAKVTKRATTLSVSVSKSSAAHFFLGLCGTGSREKRIPDALFNAPRNVVEAFIDAYVEGDGHRYRGGKTSLTTVSEKIADGLLWLLLKTGRFPAIYRRVQPARGIILKRTVNQAPLLYILVWYKKNGSRKWLLEDEDSYYVPIESLHQTVFEGDVYNMEVEEDHTYLASFIATHNCQNWITSQALRDPEAVSRPTPMTAEKIARTAAEEGARIVTSTYNEPLITSEWAVEVFKACKERGLVTSYVSNGNATPEVLKFIRPWVDLYKVDLKSFNDKHYRELGGVLSVVLDTIGSLHDMGFWMEVVTLIVPGFNDSEEELKNIARFLAGVSKDIPWHITAFHQDYKMQDHGNTSADQLLRAYEIGREAGLNYVYAGNRPGRVGNLENTYCPSCQEILIERVGYRILQDRLAPGGHCPKCRLKIPGRWD